MKNLKRILAVVGILLLLTMYAMTLIFAISGSESADGWFKVSLFCTIVIPVLLYAYALVYRYLKDRGEEIRSEALIKESTTEAKDKESATETRDKESSTETKNKESITETPD